MYENSEANFQSYLRRENIKRNIFAIIVDERKEIPLKIRNRILKRKPSATTFYMSLVIPNLFKRRQHDLRNISTEEV